MAGSKICAKCKKNLELEQFPLWIGTSLYRSTCFPCTEKKKAHRQSKKIHRQCQKDDHDSDERSDEDMPSTDQNLSVLSLNDLLAFLGRQKDTLRIEASITVGELSQYGDRWKCVDAIVNLMWEVMSYWFL
jgi:hypothetical protein